MKLQLLIFGFLLACENKASDEEQMKTSAKTKQAQQKTKAGNEKKTSQKNPTMPSTTSLSTCDIMVYVADTDPNGLNVRDEPSSKNTNILGQLPTQIPVDIRVVASQNGWFRMTSAKDINGNQKMPQTGWVYGKLLGIGIRNYGPKSAFLLHEKPDAKSKTVGDPKLGPAKLLDCQGKWLQVEANGIKGWLSPSGQCPSAVTNCP